jgi:hypothetical protein
LSVRHIIFIPIIPIIRCEVAFTLKLGLGTVKVSSALFPPGKGGALFTSRRRLSEHTIDV